MYETEQVNHLRRLVSAKNSVAVGASIESMWKQLEQSRMLSKSRTRANPSRPQIPRMVADVLVNRHFEDQTLALETLQCLRLQNNHYYYVGLLELVDAYLDLDDLDSAIECYEEILQNGDKLDQHAAERFVAKACTKASIKHLRDVLFRHKVTFQMLVSLADPLIIGGHSKIYSNAFVRYLKTTPAPNVLVVGYVLKYMLKARLRRALSRHPMTVLETQAMDVINSALAEYRDDVMDDMNEQLDLTVQEEVALQGIINYLHFASDWTGDDLPTGLSGLANEIFGSPVKINASTFNYLVEHRVLRPPDSDATDTGSIYRVKDLSSQFADLRPNVIPAYDAALFPDELEKEFALVDLIVNDIFYSLDAAEFMEEVDENNDDDDSMKAAEDYEEDEDDEFDEEDGDENRSMEGAVEQNEGDEDIVSVSFEEEDVEEIDVDSDCYKFLDRMRNAGFSKAMVDCTFNDMSQSMKTFYPEAHLEYAEDVFDGISEDSFVRDCLSADEADMPVTRIAVDDSNHPDDEGGINVGIAVKKRET